MAPGIALTEGNRNSRSTRAFSRQVEEKRPIRPGAIADGTRLAASSTIVAAYADRSFSPNAANASSSQAASRSACISRTNHHATGLNQCKIRAESSSQFIHKSPRTRCASSCARTWPSRVVDESVTTDSGKTILGFQVPTMQGPWHSGVTSNAGVRLSPIRQRDASRSFKMAASVTGRQTERCRRRTSAVASSFNPSSKQPASQIDERIRVMNWASSRRLPGSGDCVVFLEETDGGSTAALTCGSEDHGAGSTARGDSTLGSNADGSRDRPVLNRRNFAFSRASRSAVHSPPHSSRPD